MQRPYGNWATTGGCPYTDRFESTEGVSPYAPTTDEVPSYARLHKFERVAPHGPRAERKNLQPSLRGCDGERV